jgi:hypothetical protein
MPTTFEDLSLGERYRLERVRRRIPQALVELITGIPQPRLSDIELGQHQPPTPEEERKLSALYAITTRGEA